MLIFSPKLPTLVASLLIAWFSLLLVRFSTNSSTLASIFGDFQISARRTANCFKKIATKMVLHTSNYILHFNRTFQYR